MLANTLTIKIYLTKLQILKKSFSQLNFYYLNGTHPVITLIKRNNSSLLLIHFYLKVLTNLIHVNLTSIDN